MSFTDKFEPDWFFDLERCTDRLLQYKSSTSGEITTCCLSYGRIIVSKALI